jgi:hypothetical protein
MSLEYYLYCRNKYENILTYIESIDDLCSNVINITQNETNLLEEQYYDNFLSEMNNNSLMKTKKQIKILKELCDTKIFILCDHEFVDDIIDITPDKSEKIIYCKKCEYTKR